MSVLQKLTRTAELAEGKKYWWRKSYKQHAFRQCPQYRRANFIWSAALWLKFFLLIDWQAERI